MEKHLRNSQTNDTHPYTNPYKERFGFAGKKIIYILLQYSFH